MSPHFCNIFSIEVGLLVVLLINKQKVAITVCLDLPSLLFLARVSLPNWYVFFCPALDDLVEFQILCQEVYLRQISTYNTNAFC